MDTPGSKVAPRLEKSISSLALLFPTFFKEMKLQGISKPSPSEDHGDQVH
jgi:hypothetical protein